MQVVSVSEGQPIWLDICFCANCKRSEFVPSYIEGKPYFCPLWNEWRKGNDYCSDGKEE